MLPKIESSPQEDTGYVIEEEPFYLPQKNELKLFEAAFRNRLPVMLKGPTGSGKTRLVEHMAWKLGCPLHTVACHEDLSGNDLTGRYVIRGGDAEWVDGPLLMAVKHGGIAYLDEVVEARKDTIVVLHPLADHRRYLPVEKLGRPFYAPDEFMLVISYNPHYQSVLKELKHSTRQRFVSIHLGWPGEELEIRIVQQESGVDEHTAHRLVQAASKIRNLVHRGLEEGVSTRELVYAGILLRSGVPEREALFSTMIEPMTNDPDLKRGIEEVLGNYFSMLES